MFIVCISTSIIEISNSLEKINSQLLKSFVFEFYKYIVSYIFRDNSIFMTPSDSYFHYLCDIYYFYYFY